jgi:hypothetical protein
MLLIIFTLNIALLAAVAAVAYRAGVRSAISAHEESMRHGGRP